MIAFALLIGVIVLFVVPPTVWWAVTQVVPRVLAEQGLPAGARAEQEARLRRMEEAIDAIALKVDDIARQQALMGPERGVVPTQREELP